VDTPDGAGVLEKIYLTELGFVMGKVFFPKRGIWINYQLGNLDKLLEFKSIKKSINGTFRILKYKRRRQKKSVLQA
jgi:hypothetical protein